MTTGGGSKRCIELTLGNSGCSSHSAQHWLSREVLVSYSLKHTTARCTNERTVEEQVGGSWFM